ncbi:hypothetical protein AQI95_09630 [Streptomyces yokosukanensis]|uniref:Uncharacterized protein n=1 Tax=Streptomyces yokosukanensis TaxID=67386 RepID=A0A101PBP1_9ACTN|nr:hypothetical protein [Streptomyces yokosukanensis]KUN08602.1 hypothetical protein AQI95_09630 [Streptomyces yokosukanensis]
MPIEVGFRTGGYSRLLHVKRGQLGTSAVARCGAGMTVTEPAPKRGEFSRWCPMCSGQKSRAFAGVWQLAS